MSAQTRTPNQSLESPALIKFPRTTHLFDTGGSATTNDDLVLEPNDPAITCLCNGTTRVVIEEKVDGANLGVSFDPSTNSFVAQNRSHYISTGEHAQFSRLSEWIEENREGLQHVLCRIDDNSNLEDRGLIIYGEWLAARHSVPYNRLPGLFLAYDIFDRKANKFFSRKRFHTVMKDSGIPVVPVIDSRTFGPYARRKRGAQLFRSELIQYLDSKSSFRNDDGTVEGVVLRVDDENSEWLQHRYKIVRPDFVRGCNGGHWTRRQIEKQRLDFEFAAEYVTSCYPFAQTENRADDSNQTNKPTVAENEEPKAQPSAKQSAKEKKRISKEEKEYEKQRARARRRVPRCVMTMGLPASGKSTFSAKLAASSPEWIVVSQDKLGKKQAVALAGKANKKNRVIVDRCHPTASERQEWHQTLGAPSKGDVALVYFAADAETCIERAKNRTNHETIPAGKGERIVRCVAKLMEPPSKQDEQIFGTIEIVKSFEEANALLRKWGVDGEA